jgi:hypothetical protein
MVVQAFIGPTCHRKKVACRLLLIDALSGHAQQRAYLAGQITDAHANHPWSNFCPALSFPSRRTHIKRLTSLS